MNNNANLIVIDTTGSYEVYRHEYPSHESGQYFFPAKVDTNSLFVVTDYGAVADMVTDNTAAFQAAILAAEQYGGTDSACVLGQEMAGYATGEVFFVSQAMGFRHSHLDAGGYSFDQKHPEKDVAKAVDYLLADVQGPEG